MGYDGLVTNNYKMLEVAHEVAAIIATKAVVVATVSTGHDPIRAAGALLLELPGLPHRVKPNVANVFWLKYARRTPETAWHYLEQIAKQQGTTATALWASNKPDTETPVLA